MKFWLPTKPKQPLSTIGTVRPSFILDLSIQRNKMISNTSLQEESSKPVKKLKRKRLRPSSAKPGVINRCKVRLPAESFNGVLKERSKGFHHNQTDVKNLSNKNLIRKKLTNNEPNGIDSFILKL
jgi:hypothetical protein